MVSRSETVVGSHNPTNHFLHNVGSSFVGSRSIQISHTRRKCQVTQSQAQESPKRLKGEAGGWTKASRTFPRQTSIWAPCETESVDFFFHKKKSVDFFHLYLYINKHYIILTEDLFFALKCHHEVNKVNCPVQWL